MCTIKGCTEGRPLLENILLIAETLLASAARPYTVSVGMATKPPALRTSTALWIELGMISA
jgi:hypothetical protein